jgi:hypothetical protein
VSTSHYKGLLIEYQRPFTFSTMQTIRKGTEAGYCLGDDGQRSWKPGKLYFEKSVVGVFLVYDDADRAFNLLTDSQFNRR